MQYQQEVQTINKAAPPSYAEAMAYATAPPASAAQSFGPQPHGTQAQPPYSVPNYTNPENPSNVNVNSQPAYAFPASAYPQQPTNVQRGIIMHTTVIGPRKRFRDRCCSTKVTVAILCLLLTIYVVKVIVSRAIIMHR